MSRPDEPGGYDVGRGKPPREHRFAPGKSGNPNGRPKKVKEAAFDPASSDLNEIILRESQRVLTLHEDGNPITLSASEAVFRKMMVTGLKGSAHAQRSYMQTVLNAQAQRDRTRAEMIANAYALKFELEQLRSTRLAAGRREEDMSNHPSDIEFDASTGEARYFLVLTDEDRAARAKLRSFLDDAHAVLEPSATPALNIRDLALREYSREIAMIQIHFANEFLPSRFRRPPPDDVALETELGAQFIEKALASLPGIRPEFAKRLRSRGNIRDPD